MSNNVDRNLTSIIIPCWGQLEFTQQCFAALKEHTRPGWELIVIDNGSTDGTATYLAGARDLASVPVTIVTNSVNVGFPAAINQGLQLARGDYLVLLNNDVVVTDGWLDQLIALANARRGSTAEGAESDPAGTSSPPCSGVVSDSAGFTPPNPPFKGGNNCAIRGGRPHGLPRLARRRLLDPSGWSGRCLTSRHRRSSWRM